MAESKDYKRLAKKWLNEDVLPQPLDLGGKPIGFYVYGFFDDGTGRRYSTESNIKLALDSACKHRDEVIRRAFEGRNVSAYRIIIQCPKDRDDLPLGKTSFTVFEGEKKNNAWRHLEVVKGSCGKDKWVANTIPPGYYSACEPAIAESKDYKRLASKWLTEKRKISAEKNSRFLLSESKATGQLRKGTRELTVATMRMLTNAIKGRDGISLGKARNLQSAMELGLPWTALESSPDQLRDWQLGRPQSWVDGPKVRRWEGPPKFLHDLGLRDLNLVLRPDRRMSKTLTRGSIPFDVGGRFNIGGRDFDRNRSSITIEIRYDPETIKTPKDLRLFLSKINEKLQDTVAHEVRHLWQGYGSSKFRRMGGKSVWGYSHKYDQQPGTYVRAKKDYFRYLTQPSEIDAFVYGLYRRSKKTNVSFERLLKDRLEKGRLTRKQKKQIFEIWMDHARRQTPCALNNKGLPINPKGCGFSKKRKQQRANKKELRRLQQQINDNPKMKEQLQKEIAALHDGLAKAKPKPGVFRKIVSKLPLVGGILVAAGVVYFADEAYAKGGAKGLAEYGAVTAVDLTPVIGDIKGLFDTMAAILMRKGRTALKADPAFFSPARGKL